MGREVRRVPPNWKHPYKDGEPTAVRGYQNYQPLFDESFDDAMNEWWVEAQQWLRGEYKYQDDKYPRTLSGFALYHGNPPEVEYYRPSWTPEEATAYQVYETVSEGTPLTPVFDTAEELVEYLTTIGTEYDSPCSRDAALSLVKHQSLPSMMFDGTRLYSGLEVGETVD